MARALALLAWLLSAPVWANPSVFPEDAAFAALGHSGGWGAVGFEAVVPARYFDASLGLTAHAPLADFGHAGVRASGAVLLLPALGTTPPLALGLGADAGYGPGGLSLHAGPLLGSDLLFSLRLPLTVSLYVAPGYAAKTGVSVAWAAQVRYYFDAEGVALEASSSDLAPFSLGVRVLF